MATLIAEGHMMSRTPRTDKKVQSLVSLEGLQSVRTTFLLSKKAEEARHYLKKRLKITSKALIGQAINLVLASPEFDSTLREFVSDGAVTKPVGTRKTWVISKATLDLIKKKARAMKVSRDLLLEGLILSLDGMYKVLDQRKSERYSEAYDVMNKFFDSAEDAAERLRNLLGYEDPIVRDFYRVIRVVGNTISAIETEIKKNSQINTDAGIKE